MPELPTQPEDSVLWPIKRQAALFWLVLFVAALLLKAIGIIHLSWIELALLYVSPLILGLSILILLVVFLLAVFGSPAMFAVFCMAIHYAWTKTKRRCRQWVK